MKRFMTGRGPRLMILLLATHVMAYFCVAALARLANPQAEVPGLLGRLIDGR